MSGPATEHGLFVAAARHLLKLGWTRSKAGHLRSPASGLPDISYLRPDDGKVSLNVSDVLGAVVGTVEQAVDLLVTVALLPPRFHSLSASLSARLVPCPMCGVSVPADAPIPAIGVRHPGCAPIVIRGAA
jgi:hypothetical protein